MMLSRVADALYWMGRYVERADTLTRVLDHTNDLLLDMGDLDDRLQQDAWRSVSEIFLIPDAAELTGDELIDFLTIDENNFNSLVSLVKNARENARSVRDVISTELWRHINTLYWSLRSMATGESTLHNDRSEFFWQMYSSTQLFFGLTDDAIPRGSFYHLIRIGRFMERAEKTARIVNVHTRMLAQPHWKELAWPVMSLQWIHLLRKCWCFEAYRKEQTAGVDPRTVIAYIILNAESPRSIRFAVDQAHDGLDSVTRAIEDHLAGHYNEFGLPGKRPEGVVRRLGRLSSQLEYTDPAELQRMNVTAFLDGVLGQLNDITSELHQALLLYEPAGM